MTEPTVFGAQATEQIVKTVREVSRRMMNEQPHRARWQYQGGGVGSHHIWATIDEAFCDAYTNRIDYVLATPIRYTGGCDVNSVPGVDDNGMVEVVEICETFTAYYTVEQLIGKTIRATYMKTIGADPCVFEWIVDAVCGTPECA